MRKILPLFVLVLAACSPVATDVTNDDVAEGDASGTVRVGWVFTPTADSTEELPKTTLELQLTGDDTRNLAIPGTYTGVGSDAADGSGETDPGAVTTALVWWAGGGDEFSVMRPEPATLVVRHRTVDEEAGFGPYEELASFAVQPDARIVSAK